MKNQQDRRQTSRLDRRQLLARGAVAAGCLVVPSSVFGAKQASGNKKDRPSERLNVAGIGLGARGLGNMEKCDGANIVALCDVDLRRSAPAMEQYPEAAKYQDYRRMLEKESDIDAVVVSTPDHTHAVIAAEAMKRNKHVYLEVPLAHDVWEVRQLARLAEETGVVTQMGNERHSGNGIRNAVEMLWGGGLGPVREVYCWTNRPQWPQGMDRPVAADGPPAGLDWNLWLGPAPERPFNRAYHPYRWRGWADFGTGALGAMGCHLMDLACWGLQLDRAATFSVEAESTGLGEGSYPEASTIRYRFPARGDLPPVQLTWLDGGRRPAPPEGLPYLREIGSNGALFLGDDHPMMFGPTVFGTTPGQVGPRTIPEFADVRPRREFERIPRVKESSWTQGNRHIQEWLRACKEGTQPCASFQKSAPLAEMVLLGNVALLVGEPIQWDVAKLEVTNLPEANRFVRREYRSGWSL